MKAIETQYNGYLFRSRLEARWAVFFDKMGIKYEYEPEGFVLEDGTHYLPDFRVTTPQGRTIWYEVKATKDSDGLDKVRSFNKALRGYDETTRCHVLIGDPYEFTHTKNIAVCPRCGLIGDVSYGMQKFDDEMYYGCEPCDFETPSGGDNDYEVTPWAKVQPHKGSLIIDMECFKTFARKVLDAVTKARSARFEHGQTPRK